VIAKSVFLYLLSTEKRQEPHFFHYRSNDSLPKGFKAGQILDLGKSFPVVLILQMLFLTCIIVRDSKAKIISSLYTFIPSFFYILNEPNMETGVKNGMVTFIIDFYPTCLNE